MKNNKIKVNKDNIEVKKLSDLFGMKRKIWKLQKNLIDLLQTGKLYENITRRMHYYQYKKLCLIENEKMKEFIWQKQLNQKIWMLTL